MKKIIFWGLVLVIIILVSMFVFDICPPKGPWPMPPWCGSAEFTRNTFDIKAETRALSQIKAVNMFDTWGANYNFKMVENTRNNTNSSFDRVRELGAKEVYVHDFHRAVFEGEESLTSTSYKIEDETFWNDFRDESMTQEDLNNLVKSAHDRGLLLGIKHNMHFADMSKYLVSGLKGDVGKDVIADYEAYQKPHTAEWIKDYFAKWQARMVEKGAMYQSAGVDIMSVSPTFVDTSFAGNEKLANDSWKNLISEVRKVFSGKIHVELSMWDLIDVNHNYRNLSNFDYYKSADIVDMRFFYFPQEYRTDNPPTIGNMKASFSRFFDDVEKFTERNNIKLSVTFSPFSYKNAINNEIFEFNDIKNEEVRAKEKDWQHQADAYQAMFEDLVNRKSMERITVGGFSWDDAMDPEVGPRVSVNSSPRNKIAEEVIRQWFSAK